MGHARNTHFIMLWHVRSSRVLRQVVILDLDETLVLFKDLLSGAHARETGQVVRFSRLHQVACEHLIL